MRAMWVMRREALIENLNASGVIFTHSSSIVVRGMR